VSTTYAVPYRHAFGGLRPFLQLQLTAPSGDHRPILGLVDSGADTSCMPFGFASLMGYSASDLVQERGRSASGVIEMWKATAPCRASVIGLPDHDFELWPTFLKDAQMPARVDGFLTSID
jgi:hypothetical protein